MAPEVLWTESFREEEQLVQSRENLPFSITFNRGPLHELEPGNHDGPRLATIRTHSQLTDRWRETLDGVLSRSTGYDHLLEIPGTISAGYLPEYATEAVAGYNLTLTTALLRRLNEAVQSMESFDRDGLTGRELSGCRVGVVGVGRIGKATARRFLSLGNDVMGCDLEEDPDLRSRDSFRYVDLETLFAGSDIVQLCLPLTDTTRGMIDASLLESMPDRSILINTGRGEVVSNRDLLGALRDGPIEAMGLDVFHHEDAVAEALRGDREGSDHPEVKAGLRLIDHERVIATPHNAFNTEEALERKVAETLSSLEEYIRSGSFPNPVPRE